MKISIVIPAFNEAACIQGHLQDIVKFTKTLPEHHFEILVVDDGSKDATAERVLQAARQHPEIRLLKLEQNSGKSEAVKKGILDARGDIVGFTDADAATPIAELAKVLRFMPADYQVVIGSRARRSQDTVLKAKIHRRIMGRVFNAFLRGVLQIRDAEGRVLKDTQCGFKWFSRPAAQSIFPELLTKGFAFDVEVLFLAQQKKFRILEMPVNWADRRDSRVSLLSDPLKMLWQIVSIRLKH